MTGLAMAALLLGAAAHVGLDDQSGEAAPAVKTQSESEPRTLQNTRWRLTHFGDAEIALKDPPREPHLIFHAGGSVTGADGCNSIRGEYLVTGDSLTLRAPLMGTLMSCVLPDELDRRFREALTVTRRWRVANLDLELLDDEGQVVARFAPAPR